MDASVPGNLSVDVQLPAIPQPDDAKLKIPKAEDDMQLKLFDQLEELNTSADNVVKAMGDSAKLETDTSKVKEKLLEKIGGNTQDSVNNTAGEKQKKKKITEYFAKKMVAADFFTNVGNSLKNLAKKLGGGLLDVLAALMIFALLGPEFLNGIIDLVISTVMTLIQAFIRAIPIVIDAIVKWLPIIIDLVMKTIPVVFDALIQAFSSLADNPNIAPALRMFFGVLRDLAKFLKSTFMFISEHLIPVLIALGVVYLAYQALMLALWAFENRKLIQMGLKLAATIAETLASVASTAASWLLSGSMWSLVASMAAVILPILLVVGALILLYTYADEVSDFFDDLIDRFKHLGIVGKILVVWLALIFLPITIFIMEVFAVVKLFKAIKAQGGFLKLFTDLWIGIKTGVSHLIDYLAKLWDDVKSKFSLGNILDAAKDMGKKIIDSIFGQGSFAQVTMMLHDAKKTIDDLVEKFFASDFVKWLISHFKGATVGTASDDKNTRLATDIGNKLGFQFDKAEGITNAIQTREGIDEQITYLKSLDKNDTHVKDALAALVAAQGTVGPGEKTSHDILQKIFDVLKNSGKAPGALEPSDFKTAFAR